MAVLEIYLEILTNFFEILHPPLNPNPNHRKAELQKGAAGFEMNYINGVEWKKPPQPLKNFHFNTQFYVKMSQRQSNASLKVASTMQTFELTAHNAF